MEQFHEEQDLGKVFDGHLLRRLLRYAKPYWLLIGISIIVVLMISATDLSRPYLVKIAIDDHILGANKPYVAVDNAEKYPSAVNIQGYNLVREDRLESGEEGQSFIFKKEDGEQLLISGEEELTLVLDADELKLLRSWDTNAMVRLGIILFFIILVNFLLNYAQAYLLQYTGQRIVFDIRQHLFEHLQRLALSFFDGNPVGRLITRVTNDTQNLHEMYTAVLVNLFKDVFMVLGIVVVMFRLNTFLAWTSLATLPLIVALTAWFRIRAREAYRVTRVRVARINADFAENISGMRLVQIFRQEKRKFNEFKDINASHYDASMRELKVYAVFRPAMELVYTLAVAFLIWNGGGKVIQGAVEFGVLYAFINYLEQFFRPINDLTEKYNILQSSMASAERLFQILDQDPAIVQVDNPLPMGEVKGKIEFKNVWFAYVDEEWVLRDVSFTVEPGETAAFVGATGAGKSTIMNLLSRFYDIQKGQILIDGQDIKLLNKEELRRNVGVVMQVCLCFPGILLKTFD